MKRSAIESRVAAYLDRTDLAVKIVQWIEDARIDLSLKYPFKFLYAESTASTTAGTARYAMPTDYLGHAVLWCGSKKLSKLTPREFDELTQTDIDASAEYRLLTTETSVNESSISGAPDYYVERGMEFEIYPTPDAVYTLKIKYYAQPTSWDPSNDGDSGGVYDDSTDYITTFHAEAVIWGAALRGAIYLDDEQKKANFSKVYDATVQEMIKREKEHETEDQHFRMKTWRDYDLATIKRLLKVRVN
jgi:hypothetical protein